MRIRSHWRNESCVEDERGHRVRWRFPWHGRYWLNVGRPEHRRDYGFRFEWVLCEWKGLAAEIEFGPHDDEPGIGGHLNLLFAAFFWQLSTPWLRKRAYMLDRNVNYSLTFWYFFEDLTLRLSWGGDPMAWSAKDPWYWSWSLNLPDAIFGRATTTEHEVDRFDIVVTMPEGVYSGSVAVTDMTWRRPRWPLIWRQRRSSWVELRGAHGPGIPTPGKGENSWDCGEDAIHAMGSAHVEPAKIVDDVIVAVETKRRRYGGDHWRPARAI